MLCLNPTGATQESTRCKKGPKWDQNGVMASLWDVTTTPNPIGLILWGQGWDGSRSLGCQPDWTPRANGM